MSGANHLVKMSCTIRIFFIFAAVTATMAIKCEDPKETYVTCGGCEPTCTNYDTKMDCGVKCTAGCQCKPAFVRNVRNNKCVEPARCPNAKPSGNSCPDPKNEVYYQCGSCERTCEDIHGRRTSCTRDCHTGCQCGPSLVRDGKSNRCINPKECPQEPKNNDLTSTNYQKTSSIAKQRSNLYNPTSTDYRKTSSFITQESKPYNPTSADYRKISSISTPNSNLYNPTSTDYRKTSTITTQETNPYNPISTDHRKTSSVITEEVRKSTRVTNYGNTNSLLNKGSEVTQRPPFNRFV